MFKNNQKTFENVANWKCCLTVLAARAVISEISFSKGETILAASAVERFYPGHRRRLLSTRNSASRNAKADMLRQYWGESLLPKAAIRRVAVTPPGRS